MLMVAPPLSAVEEATFSVPNDQVMTDFYDQLAQDIHQAHARVDAVVKEADGAQVNMAEWLPKLQEALLQLKVKFSIAWDFRDTPMLLSSAIRERLLTIMAKEEIQQQDIRDLQILVDSEKARIDKVQGIDVRAHVAGKNKGVVQ